MATIDVVLAERDTIARRGALRDLKAARGIRVVGETGDGNDLLAIVREQLPKVVVLADQLDGRTGLEVLPQFADSIHTLIFTSREDGPSIYRALIAGARGYVLKWDPDMSLVEAVKQVANGEIIISKRMLKPLVTTMRERASHDAEPLLTDREKQILALLGQGKTYKQIGDIIKISEHTVKTRCSGIYRKLGVHNQTGAVMKAISLGLIDAEDG